MGETKVEWCLSDEVIPSQPATCCSTSDAKSAVFVVLQEPAEREKPRSFNPTVSSTSCTGILLDSAQLGSLWRVREEPREQGTRAVQELRGLRSKHSRRPAAALGVHFQNKALSP